jgi:hypothetical protein
MKRNEVPLPTILDSEIEIMASVYTPTGFSSGLSTIILHSFIIKKIGLDMEVFEHQRLMTNELESITSRMRL